MDRIACFLKKINYIDKSLVRTDGEKEIEMTNMRNKIEGITTHHRH